MVELEALAAAKDEITEFKDQLNRLKGMLDGAGGQQGQDQATSCSQVGVSSATVREGGVHSVTHSEGENHTPQSSRPRKAKVPPLDPFTGEASDV